MSNKKENTTESNAFQYISTPEDLIIYLDSADRFRNYSYLYHYTKLSSVIKIIQSGYWHLCSAKSMNDKLEYNDGDIMRWHDLFFACFMVDSKESIGMWSMYAQPWEIGVKIAIPVKIARRWIQSSPEIIEISEETHLPTGRKIYPDEHESRLWLSSVAYSNFHSAEDSSKSEVLKWSTAADNLNFTAAPTIPELTGYIKDMAWSYEKEVRIKLKFDNRDEVQRVGIRIPDYVIDSMTITASPLFEGNLEDILKREIARTIQVNNSLFKDRLNIKTVCEDCNLKKTQPN